MCCVPTLLATVEEDLPALRFLLVSGEACPHDLVLRWHRPGRRFLNVYGPTEATVSATWVVVDPDRPVTIGVPLPTYATVILDPDDPGRALPHGEVGEIGITGIGLARRSSPTSWASPATSRAASTARATSAASPWTARSSTSAGSTCRSRSAGTASS
jgi:non-ribosomal peptide synthetase component F